jgi:ribosomal protein S18 acetylase RimI-like enzyme
MAACAIRRLGPADAEDYRRIRLAALQGDPDAFSSTYEAEAARPPEHFQQRLQRAAVFGAYAASGVVGMVGYQRHEGARERHKAFVWGTYVIPAYRGAGVGRALMQALLQSAALEVEQLTLVVVTDNPGAQGLYRGCGFEPYGTEPRALRRPDGYADDLLMVRFLR